MAAHGTTIWGKVQVELMKHSKVKMSIKYLYLCGSDCKTAKSSIMSAYVPRMSAYETRLIHE